MLGQDIAGWDDLFALRDQPVHVVGAGSVEGAHLLMFLLDNGFTRLVGHDFSTPEDFPRTFRRIHVGWPLAERRAMLERVQREVELRYRDRYLEGIEAARAIAVTQAWYLYEANRPLLESDDLQARFFSLVQLYLALAPGLVVGVSGSQGKSTTTRLLRDMLVAGGREVIFAGNDRHGRQALDGLREAPADSILLLEISNRHLKVLNQSPDVAVLTNVYPNHLDEHGGWEGYVEAKSRMVRHQRRGDIAVLNADQEVTRDMAALTPARILWFGEEAGGDRPGVVVGDDGVASAGLGDLRIARADVPLQGRHNLLNVAAAATAALALEVPAAAITAAVSRFQGLKHRIQFVWKADGVEFYDDLNSTTPTATRAALETLGEGVTWILGGDDKGLDGSELAAVAKRTVRHALALPGAGTDRLVAALRAEGIEAEPVADLAAAVARAVILARPGDRVLLSPACPGFFSLYYAAGEEDVGFRKLVRDATLGRASARGEGTPAAGAAGATSLPARKPRR
ncbi:MAG: UDP-N-acetylmuramoylalanine--D-glutamate ligase [Chloroflexota bacterium]|nr:UDP-N-acetylmuramoylalanine--D-glutamate ligase [Chloroflexota bacterium]